MNLDNAIANHAEWKMKFRSAITKQEVMNAETLAKDNCCDLGKWLHGEANSKYSKLATYSACISKHAAFHIEASKVAKTINAKRYEQAEAMLASGTPYALASNAVGLAIMGLKKEAKL